MRRYVGYLVVISVQILLGKIVEYINFTPLLVLIT